MRRPHPSSFAAALAVVAVVVAGCRAGESDGAQQHPGASGITVHHDALNVELTVRGPRPNAPPLVRMYDDSLRVEFQGRSRYPSTLVVSERNLGDRESFPEQRPMASGATLRYRTRFGGSPEFPSRQLDGLVAFDDGSLRVECSRQIDARPGFFFWRPERPALERFACLPALHSMRRPPD